MPSKNAANLRARFENMAQQSTEEAKKRAEEEKKRRQDRERREREEAKRKEEARIKAQREEEDREREKEEAERREREEQERKERERREEEMMNKRREEEEEQRRRAALERQQSQKEEEERRAREERREAEERERREREEEEKKRREEEIRRAREEEDRRRKEREEEEERERKAAEAAAAAAAAASDAAADTGDVGDDVGVKATALYDYQAAAEDEISFDPGDVITNIEMVRYKYFTCTVVVYGKELVVLLRIHCPFVPCLSSSRCAFLSSLSPHQGRRGMVAWRVQGEVRPLPSQLRRDGQVEEDQHYTYLFSRRKFVGVQSFRPQLPPHSKKSCSRAAS